MKRKLRNDLILVGIILLVVIAGIVVFRLTAAEGSTLSISVDGKEQYSYPLSKDLKSVITTAEGKNVLVIQQGRAYVSEADCPDGICAAHRPISMVGETIVCLPHKLVIEVKGE